MTDGIVEEQAHAVEETGAATVAVVAQAFEAGARTGEQAARIESDGLDALRAEISDLRGRVDAIEGTAQTAAAVAVEAAADAADAADAAVAAAVDAATDDGPADGGEDGSPRPPEPRSAPEPANSGGKPAPRRYGASWLNGGR